MDIKLNIFRLDLLCQRELLVKKNAIKSVFPTFFFSTFFVEDTGEDKNVRHQKKGSQQWILGIFNMQSERVARGSRFKKIINFNPCAPKKCPYFFFDPGVRPLGITRRYILISFFPLLFFSSLSYL